MRELTKTEAKNLTYNGNSIDYLVTKRIAYGNIIDQQRQRIAELEAEVEVWKDLYNVSNENYAELEAELKEERQRSYVMSLRNGWKKCEELEAELEQERKVVKLLDGELKRDSNIRFIHPKYNSWSEWATDKAKEQ